ncbi:MAG: fatty acid desaturase [Myxococcaceae bacterium]|jgi:fatty acid desaturase|nr:fatty acid desaturase [Myxococcaceae bacterium]
MLRFRADRRTIATLLLHSVSTGLLWWASPSTAWALVPAVVWLSALSWVCAIIAHNVVHTPVFRSRPLNAALQVWVSLSYGFPISDYVPGHNLSHHRYTQQAEDVMRTTRVRFRWNLLNLLAFLPAVTPGIVRGNALYLRRVGWRVRAWRRQLVLELIVVWSVKLALTLLDWRKALLFVWIPHLFANWGIVTVNLVQHDGCDETHPVNHSRNFVGRFFNWVTFNNGYHGAHHLMPGLHWSLLPAFHAEHVKPTLHPALDQPSLARYVFRTFVWPGRRLTFDGRPVEPVDLPDRDWVRGDDDRLPPDGVVPA